MELHEALAQISEIRTQIARTEVFRGYRSLPAALSGVLALAVAALQHELVPSAANHVWAYLALWVAAAVVSALGAGAEMAIRYWRSTSQLTREITWLVAEQFLPCTVAGGLITFVLATSAPESVWVLPGLWQILFGLGLFAAYRLLPRAIFWVGVFYMLAGVLSLVLARGDLALSPWAMGIPFSVGQFLTAAILYWTLERTDVRE